MADKRWKKIVARSAEDVIGDAELSDESKALLAPGSTPEAFIGELDQAGQTLDAVKVLAYSLPRREAAWWACKCVPEMQDVSGSKSELLCLDAAEKWVYEPVDDRRLAAFQAAQESKTSSGGVMCAMAAAFSEAALPINDDQQLDIDISTFPGLIFAAIALAAAEGDGSQMDERLSKYLKIGEEIANGGSGKLE